MKSPSELGANSDASSASADAQPAPRKKGRFWRNFGILSLLIIGGAAAFATLTQKGRDLVEVLPGAAKMAISVQQNPNLIFDNAHSDHVNILLIGRDVNWKETKVFDPTTKTYRRFHVHDENTPARSDTMIVMTLDKNRKTVRMVSFPRDARVYIPENDVQTGISKLNAAHAFGGPELLVKTLHDELGLTIHRYAVIRFEGFKKLIDQVGGIEVNVDGALKKDPKTGKHYRGHLKYDDDYGNLHIDLQPGMQTLNGQQAHDYVRFRMDEEGDPGRIRRQQQVMRALAKKIMSSGITQIPGLVKQMREQFKPLNISDDELASAANFARNLGNAQKIQPITLFGVYTRRGSVVLNRPKNEKLLSYVFGNSFDKRNFLVKSPSTDDDEIGLTNDTNPASMEILKAAGIEEVVNSDAQKIPVMREENASAARENHD